MGSVTIRGEAVGGVPGRKLAAFLAHYASLVLAAGPVAYYRFREASGSVCSNFLGSGNDGTYYGTVGYQRSGPFSGGYAILFDGVGTYISIPRTIQDDFTIEFWLRTIQSASGNTFYQGAGLVNAECPGSTDDFGTALGTSGYIYGGTGNPDTHIASTSINDGKWHHYAITRKKTTGAIKVYVDGVPGNTGTGGTQSLTVPTSIAIGRIATGSGYFQGSIAEVALYAKELSAAEIKAHFQAI